MTDDLAEPPETCAGCGFDGAWYDLDDTLGTLRAIAPMLRSTVDGTDERLLLAARSRGLVRS